MLNRLNDYYQRALDGEIVLTKFLDLDEIAKVKALQKDDLKVYFEGGYQDAERVRAIIQNKNYPKPEFSDFKIKIYQASFNQDYGKIGHRNVLGSIMSLGIERNTFGDIYLYDNQIYLFVSQEIAKYLISNMPLINNQNLNFIETDKISDFHLTEEKYTTVNVVSLRLDVLVARCLNISRNKACEMIEEGLVAINHLVCTSVDRKCNLNEIISIRKFGRITILEILKTTKKDRLIIKVGVKH